jgi:putative colanic acid biosynthesis acetyltransferase WcaF
VNIVKLREGATKITTKFATKVKGEKMRGLRIGLDVAGNRAVANYTRGEMLWRILWTAGQWLFRMSPRPCFAWRRFVLRCFGAKVGAEVNVYGSTRICFPWNLEAGDWSAIGEWALIYNPGRVRIGQKVTISHGAHVCAGTHDYTLATMPLVRRGVEIRDGAWVCADAFVGPGVTIGEGAVVGARAVAVKDVPAWTVVAGNPARPVKKRELKGR